MCSGYPHQDVPSSTVTASHVTQGVRIYDTPRYGRGVGFVGGWVGMDWIDVAEDVDK
jgi:hypothetical protein